jgi:hypothetical protein
MTCHAGMVAVKMVDMQGEELLTYRFHDLCRLRLSDFARSYKAPKR